MTANNRHFTICHNDDSPSDPSHRRVALTVYKNDGLWWLTFPEQDGAEHISLGRTLAQAMDSLDSIYPAGGAWDRKPD